MDDLREECFGRCRRDSDCRDCDLMASCLCISETEAHIEQHSGMSSVEELEGWSKQLSVPPEVPDGDPEPEPDEHDLTRLSEFCRFIFSLDDYTLGILAAIIVPDDAAKSGCTVTDLAHLHGCTRQAMHRKMLASVHRHPELAQLFRVALRKIGRGRMFFRGREACRA